jgi:hypothetical protein
MKVPRFVRMIFWTDDPIPPAPPAPKLIALDDEPGPSTPYPTHLLVDLEMSAEEYHALPHIWDLNHKWLQDEAPFGFRFRANDGHIVEIVEGSQMFCCQVGANLLGLPERGACHYRRVDPVPVPVP